MTTLRLTPSMTQSLRKISKVGHDTEDFELLGMQLRIRTLSRQELSEATRYAVSYYDGEDVSSRDEGVKDFFQTYKTTILSYALVRIDDLDFTDVLFVEIPDEAQNFVKKQKHVVLRELLQGWQDTAISAVHSKLTDLTTLCTQKATEGLVFKAQTEEERLVILEDKIQKMRSDLGMPRLVEVGTEPLQNTPVEPAHHSEDLDSKDVLKTRVFSPIPDQEPQPQPTPPEVVNQVERTPEEDELQQEQERLFQERAEKLRREAQQNPPHETPDAVVYTPPVNLTKDTQRNDISLDQKPKGTSNPNFYKPS